MQLLCLWLFQIFLAQFCAICGWKSAKIAKNCVKWQFWANLTHDQTVHAINLCHILLRRWVFNATFMFLTFSNFYGSILRNLRLKIGENRRKLWAFGVKWQFLHNLTHHQTVHAIDLCHIPLRRWVFNATFMFLTFSNFYGSILRNLRLKIGENRRKLWAFGVKWQFLHNLTHDQTVHAIDLCHIPLQRWVFNATFMFLTFSNLYGSILRNLRLKIGENRQKLRAFGVKWQFLANLTHDETVHAIDLCHIPLRRWVFNATFMFLTFSNFYGSILHNLRLKIGEKRRKLWAFGVKWQFLQN